MALLAYVGALCVTEADAEPNEKALAQQILEVNATDDSGNKNDGTVEDRKVVKGKFAKP